MEVRCEVWMSTDIQSISRTNFRKLSWRTTPYWILIGLPDSSAVVAHPTVEVLLTLRMMRAVLLLCGHHIEIPLLSENSTCLWTHFMVSETRTTMVMSPAALAQELVLGPLIPIRIIRGTSTRTERLNAFQCLVLVQTRWCS